MAIVQTPTGLQRVQAAAPPATVISGSGAWSSGTVGYVRDPYVYAGLYATQPNVRTCVDFLARNVAQLGIHVFRRVSDTDRERLADHELADWLNHPTPFMTRYRLIESTMQDLGIYFNAFWLKMRGAGRIALQRLPPPQITAAGGLVPDHYEWTSATGEVFGIPTADIVHFSGYDPLNPLMGLSPLETLRQILAEDVAATAHR